MDRRWLAAWIVAFTVVGLAIIGYETFLRSHDFFPTVQDDKDLWSLQRDRVHAHSDAIALLGASRIQYAVDPSLVQRATGRETAMLAVNAAYPLALLRDLAADPTFRGLAIVGIDARGFAKRHWEMQQPWVDHYRHRWTLARKIHRVLLTPLQEHLVLIRSPFSAVQMLRRKLAGFGLPVNDYVVMQADRLGLLDYRRTNIAAIRERRLLDLADYYRDNPPDPPEKWLADLEPVTQWIRTIQARGGRVVLFREPSGDGHLALDEANYPRAKYWDAYAKVCPAEMIEFGDEPAFLQLPLPDTSHIDGTEIPRFTRVLLDVLVKRGVLKTGTPPA